MGEQQPMTQRAINRAARRAGQQRLSLERNSLVMARTRVDERGQRRCLKHGKVYYGTEGKAHAGLIEHARRPESDPGAEVYGCHFTRGFHIGHPNHWKSFGRLLDEAGWAS